MAEVKLLSSDDIATIRGEFEPVDGSKLATALDRCEAALNRLQALEMTSAQIRGQAGRADGFLSRLINHQIDITTVDDLLGLVKDAQATQAAVSAIEVTARAQIAQARTQAINQSSSVNNIAKLLYERRRAQKTAPGRYDAVLVKYCDHEPQRRGGIAASIKRRVAAV